MGMNSYGRSSPYSGEWLPSNAGTYADAVKTASAVPASAVSPTVPAAAPGASPKRASGQSGRRGLFAGIAATALVAGTGGAVAGTAGTLSLLQRRGALGQPTRPIPLAAAPVSPVVTAVQAMP